MKNTNSGLIARKDLYNLLSLGFNYPNRLLYEEIRKKKYYNALQASLSGSGINNSTNKFSGIDDILSLGGIPYEDFESDYISSFEANVPRPYCSLYEGHYRRNVDRANILLELVAFYKNFGLEKAEIFKDSEDHISIELEFMHFLIFKEWQSSETKLDKTPYFNCQRDFVERHLSKWIFEFCEDVNKKVKLKFFHTLADIIHALVKSDIKRLNL